MTVRERLPYRHKAETFDFQLGHFIFTATLGFYPDNVRVGEVFLNAGKAGTDLHAATRDAAILLSFALQHGATTEEVRNALTRKEDGTADGPIGALLDVLAGEMRA